MISEDENSREKKWIPTVLYGEPVFRPWCSKGGTPPIMTLLYGVDNKRTPFDAIYSDEFEDVTLNGQVLPDDELSDIAIDWITNSLAQVTVCSFCSTKLCRAGISEIIEPKEEWREVCTVAECPHCGHWYADWYQDLGQGVYGCPTAEWEAHISKLSEFSKQLPEGCHRELAQHLRANPDLWCSLSAAQLEKLVAEIFRYNYQSSEVIHVGRPGDGGVDVIFVDSGSRRWLIQVKRRMIATASEGVETIRNLLGVMVIEGTRYGAVVSTADHFTYQAFNARQTVHDKGYTIWLVDRGRLDRLVEPLLPNREWQYLVQKRKPEWLSKIGECMPDRRQLTFRDIFKPSR
jgi:hypothetical protein